MSGKQNAAQGMLKRGSWEGRLGPLDAWSSALGWLKVDSQTKAVSCIAGLN